MVNQLICWIAFVPAALAAGQISNQTVGQVSGSNVQRTVSESLKVIAAGGTAASDSPEYADAKSAFERLKTVASDVAVSSIAQALRVNEEFAGSESRRWLYALLSEHEAEQMLLGREQLLAGLTEDDHRIAMTCAQSLARGDNELKRSAVEKLGAYLHYPAEELLNGAESLPKTLSRLSRIIEALGYFGTDAEDYLDDIENIFRSEELAGYEDDEPRAILHPTYPSGATERLRASALRAVWRIAGCVGIVRYLEDTDASGRKLLLASFGYQGSKTRGAFDGKVAHQQRIRRFVVESFDSPSLGVRKAAFESLLYVFGDDGVVFDSPTDYRLNPEFEQALVRMAANEPDEGLRQRAAKSLEQVRQRLNRAAEKILRRRQQQQGDGPAGKP